MLFNATIDLIDITESKNKYAEILEQKTYKTVFANVKSVRQSEFYAAQTDGVKPEIMFVIRNIEYSGEQMIEYRGQTYKVLRTFTKNGELLELVCIKGVR